MRKLKSDLKELKNGLFHFRYTNIIVLLIIFLAGFLVSALINKPVHLTLYAQDTSGSCGGAVNCGGKRYNPNQKGPPANFDVVPNQQNQNQNRNQQQNNQQNVNIDQNQPVANPTYGCLSGQPCASPAPSKQVNQNQQNQNNNQNQNQQPVNNNQVPNQQNNPPVQNNNVQNPQQPQNNDGLIGWIQQFIQKLQYLLGSLK